MKHKYTMNVEIYTVEEYLEEIQDNYDAVTYDYGAGVKAFVWALMVDESVGYYQRFFAPIYVDTLVGHAAAVNRVTLDLLQEYEEYIKKAENK